MRVVAVRDALPGADVWLVWRRHVETQAWPRSLCHAPMDPTRATQVRRSGMRWPSATCCEDGKHRLGRGADAVRGWTGWHQRRAVVILAHFCVVRLSLRCNKKPPR